VKKGGIIHITLTRKGPMGIPRSGKTYLASLSTQIHFCEFRIRINRNLESMRIARGKSQNAAENTRGTEGPRRGNSEKTTRKLKENRNAPI